MATTRRLRLPPRNPPHQRRQIQKDRPPRPIRKLELGIPVAQTSASAGQVRYEAVMRTYSAVKVQVHYDQDLRSEETIAGGALVELERLAAAEDADAGHGDVHARRIEFHPG